MKILVLQDYLRSGGTERQSVLLANAFAAAGHASTLLTFRPGGPLAPTIAAGVRHRSCQPSDWGLDWFAPGLLSTARGAAPDVTLCLGRMANCYAGALEKQGRTIATMRTGKPLPWLFRRSLHQVSHVVANSTEARETLVREHRVPRDKIAVIYNSLVFPPEASLTRNTTLRAAHGATAQTCVLLCVAMFRREKNQRELIEIVASLPPHLDWQLWLAGDGSERGACERLAAERQLAARIKFLGFHRNPAPLYTAADLAVHASWSESLSNFLIEAQAHGLPAIACEAQGIRECFVPGRTGWAVPRDDRASFRDALTRCIREPAAVHAERAAEARAFARQTFDPARQVSAYLELFQRLVSRP